MGLVRRGVDRFRLRNLVCNVAKNTQTQRAFSLFIVQAASPFCARGGGGGRDVMDREQWTAGREMFPSPVGSNGGEVLT